MELTEMTSKGTAGESIPVEIRRGDQNISIYIPRGPLGIRLGGKKINPSL